MPDADIIVIGAGAAGLLDMEPVAVGGKAEDAVVGRLNRPADAR